MSKNFLDISKNFLEMSKNFLDISKNFLDVSKKFLEIPKQYLENKSETKIRTQTNMFPSIWANYNSGLGNPGPVFYLINP